MCIITFKSPQILGVNDVNECRSEASCRGAMFTPVDDVNDVNLESDRAPTALFLSRRPYCSPRRLHVNDGNPQCWHVVYTAEGT